MFFLWPRNKAEEFWMGWWDIPSAEETEILQVLHQDHVDNFFDYQGVVHKEFIPEGKTVNTVFYKGVMDQLLKHIQWVHPAAFCSWDFFQLYNNAPIHKPASVCQFLTQNNVKTLYHPPPPILSRFISARLFSVPQVENEFKKTLLCRCYWDPIGRNWWIKEGPKGGIFGSFAETVQPLKSLYICQWCLFWIKKPMCLPYVFSIFEKNQSLNFWTALCKPKTGQCVTKPKRYSPQYTCFITKTNRL